MFLACDVKPFEKKVYLSSPTMHGEERVFVKEAFDTNWMSTIGKNIDEAEELAKEKIGCKYAVALTTGTAALHLAVRLSGVKREPRFFARTSHLSPR